LKIIHNIGLRIDSKDQVAEFCDVGVKLLDGVKLPRGGRITSFQIQEDDPRWEKVALLAKRFRAIDSVSTRFSAAEVKAAESLGMFAKSHHGYPEPSDNNGYLQATFDLADYCSTCGIGLHQTAPFRVKKTSIPKDRSILQLNWIFDEYFVTPRLWSAVFKPFDIGFRPVLDVNGNQIDSVVQLDIQEIVDLRLDGKECSACPSCGRKKHRLLLRGPLPEPSDTTAMIFKSSQYFGSGSSAYRLVLVSHVLYERLREAKVKGVAFYPCGQI
jgi:hypothetical protein